MKNLNYFRHYHITALLIGLLCCFSLSSTAFAHPLGNFTINHFSRLQIRDDQIQVHYVVDMAEIPAFQELQPADKDANGVPTASWLKNYGDRIVAQYASGLTLTVDGEPMTLKPVSNKVTLPPGAGGLATLRLECDLAGTYAANPAVMARQIRFEDTNFQERIGWRELIVVPDSSVNIFNSTAFGTGITDELKAYPETMLTAPLNERVAEFSFTKGTIPAGAAALKTRDGKPVAQNRDRLAELIAIRELTPGIALLGLLIAFVLGGMHAMSPGHGKTVVGAYLVGSRGTVRHAAFLGLTVTITHTAGVFALGVITLFASKYVLPERLFPILSFISGAIVVAIGVRLLIQRLRAVVTGKVHDHHHHDHHHDHHHHNHDHHSSYEHTHDGHTHSHVPPGVDGSPVTWRSLLALGISGGLLPCPSALVVLLSAISLHRVGYGLLLVLAFSFGLAGVLTAIGLMFVLAGRLIESKIKSQKSESNGPLAAFMGWAVKYVPVASSLVVACLGLVICLQTLPDLKVRTQTPAPVVVEQKTEPHEAIPSLVGLGALGVLGLGLVFGLKHATEADHVVAVSTIVSEHRSLARAAIVGGLWGVGHTISIVIVGVVVLVLRISIPEIVSSWLEFGIALMIIGLGANALMRALRKRSDVHVHTHAHDGHPHNHIHFHEDGTRHHEHVPDHSHSVTKVGFKPLLVGAAHGLAGSAALTLLVLTQISSVWLGILYLLIFGIGSIGGMLLMSGLVGLPFALTSSKLTNFHQGLRIAAGMLSIVFGLWYAYETAVTSGLLANLL